MSTVREVLKWATTKLSTAQCTSPETDAQLLLAFALKVDRKNLPADQELTPEQSAKFTELIEKRAQRIPLQHLTGQAFFRYLELEVGPGVFIPRPETELLVEAGLVELNKKSGAKLAVDLCAGSGAIALSLALESPNTTVHAVEVSTQAFVWLEKNVAAHSEQLARLNSTVITYNEDATNLNVLSALNGTVDVVLSNPPYIPDEMIPREPEVRDHDPKLALFGGPDGLDVARKVSIVAANLLKPNGFFGMEHADVQGESAVDLLSNTGGKNLEIWSQVIDHVDYNQLPRFVTAIRTSAEIAGLQ